MATRQSTAPARTAPAHQQQQAAARPEPSEDAADRIDAFLASMHTVQGRAVPRRIHAARVAIDRIATHPSDDGIPDVDLTAQEVADVLHFLGAIEPKKPAIWWAGTEGRVWGLRTVLYALERNVRGESPSAEPTRFLEGDLALAPEKIAAWERARLETELDRLCRDLHRLQAVIGLVCVGINDATDQADVSVDVADGWRRALELVDDGMERLAEELEPEVFLDDRLLAHTEAQEVAHG